MRKLRYKRILLKMSGEALSGNTPFGIDPKVLDRIASEITELNNMQVQVGIVIGGGNLFRGAALSEAGLTRVSGDYMGMLATIMNAIALRDALVRANIETRVMSAIAMSGVTDVFYVRKAIHHLERNRVVIFAGGTGNPFFTTDSAASLRSIEIEADVMLKATKVDGVYSADPVKNSAARKYDNLTYNQILEKNLRVMDSTAVCLCREYDMPIIVFNMNKAEALKKVVMGEVEGTLVSG